MVARNRAGLSPPIQHAERLRRPATWRAVARCRHRRARPGHAGLLAPTSDGGLPILEYLARCGDATVAATTSPILIAGLVNGTEVSCTVRARNVAGTGPLSNARTATPRAAPGKPQIVQSDSASQEIQIRVAIPPDNGAPILHYVGRCASGETAMSAGAVPIVRLLGLVNGQSYTCTVEAVNAIGASLPSDPVTLVPAGPPGPPTLLALRSAPASLAFEFSAPTFDNGGPITGYEFACNRDGTLFSTTVAVQPPGFTYTGLVAGVPHECWIHAKNRGGSSAWSNRLTATPAAPPGAPVLNSVTPLDGGARLSFTAPADDGGSPINQYQVRVFTRCGNRHRRSRTDRRDRARQQPGPTAAACAPPTSRGRAPIRRPCR